MTTEEFVNKWLRDSNSNISDEIKQSILEDFIKVLMLSEFRNIHPYYSGEASETFWTLVNLIKNDEDRHEIYSLGVDLQNLEENVLNQLFLKISK